MPLPAPILSVSVNTVRTYLYGQLFVRTAPVRRARVVSAIADSLDRLPEAVQRRFAEAGGLDSIPKTVRLLSTSAKTIKGEALGVRTGVLYLSPSRESGLDLCPFASPECRATCLGHSSGRMVMDSSRRARIWRTVFALAAPGLFGRVLAREILAIARTAKSRGEIPAVRLDGTSDLGIMAPWLADKLYRWHGVRAYEYTKSLDRATAAVGSALSVTFSASGRNEEEVARALELGLPVATVLPKGQSATTTEIDGVRAVNGDESDARFLDRSRFGIGPAEGFFVLLDFKSGKRLQVKARGFVRS